MRNVCLTVLLACGACFGQTTQAPASADELKFLRFMLLNVASLDHSPDAIQAYEGLLVKQLGLNSQESAAIHSAGQTLNAVLGQYRRQLQGITAGKTSLSDTDKAALAALDAQREQEIVVLANQVLNTVLPVTAARLRVPGHILAGSVGTVAVH